jgi:hypothetical protein
MAEEKVNMQEREAVSTLRGLKRMYLSVECLHPRVRKVGLSADQIETNIGKKLLNAGIEVLPFTDTRPLMTGEFPLLYVFVYITRGFLRMYDYFARVELRQKVALVRAPEISALAITWKTKALATGQDREKLMRSIEECVEKFIEAHRSANPQ